LFKAFEKLPVGRRAIADGGYVKAGAARKSPRQQAKSLHGKN
jgi:hypothetical protein